MLCEFTAVILKLFNPTTLVKLGANTHEKILSLTLYKNSHEEIGFCFVKLIRGTVDSFLAYEPIRNP